MQPLEAAILRTLLYADVFHFALTSHEIHRYLIHDEAVSYDDLAVLLKKSPFLASSLCHDDLYFCLADNPQHLTQRREQERLTQVLWSEAERYAHWLAQIPFVQMVALTGALAVRNPAHAGDDFDYMLVTQPKRVWLARAFAVVLVRLVRLFGREICPNYVLASDQLLQARQDIFIAHEIAQMHAFYGHALYEVMITENSWAKDYLPNFVAFPNVDKPSRWFKGVLENLLKGALGDKLEAWEYRRKLAKFSPKIQAEVSAAELDEGHVKGHFEDHGYPILEKYQARLRQYGLAEMAIV